MDLPMTHEVIVEEPEPVPAAPLNPLVDRRAIWLRRQPGKHVRADITKNKSQGKTKRCRLMVKASRRRNRGK